MSNETKRDVFEQLLNEHQNLISKDNGMHINITTPLNIMYDDALPDDLPVIPKEVGEYIKSNRTEPLGKVFWHLGCISASLLGSTRLYIVDHSEVFARAWVLGVWRVEENGEIVKL